MRGKIVAPSLILERAVAAGASSSTTPRCHADPAGEPRRPSAWFSSWRGSPSRGSAAVEAASFLPPTAMLPPASGSDPAPTQLAVRDPPPPAPAPSFTQFSQPTQSFKKGFLNERAWYLKQRRALKKLQAAYRRRRWRMALPAIRVAEVGNTHLRVTYHEQESPR